MRGKIAFEEHFVTPELKDTIFPSIGWDPDEWTAMADQLQDTGERRLADMDAAGIDLAVLSLAAPCIQDEVDPLEAAGRARAANDALAGIVRAHANSLCGARGAPTSGSECCRRGARALRQELGFKGALANGYSSVGDLATAAYYDEPQYQPFWERVAALGVPFYLHPRNPLPTQRRICDSREALLGPTWAFTVETATHVLRLIVSGLFDRLPTLTIVIGHMGELLPFGVQRTEQRLSHIPSIKLDRPPQQCLRENFYLTTSGNFHTPSLLGAMLRSRCRPPPVCGRLSVRAYRRRRRLVRSRCRSARLIA